MPITLEPFVRFTCFNFCLKALESFFPLVLTAGASDPCKRQNSAAAGSYRQPCKCGNPTLLNSKKFHRCKCPGLTCGINIEYPIAVSPDLFACFWAVFFFRLDIL